MANRQRWLGILLALTTLVGRLAHAGDGVIDWRTLRAPGIELSYPRTHEDFARRVLATWQDARKALGAVLPLRDVTLQLTIDDFADTANGSASVMPYDHVHLLAFPPGTDSELGDHGDWIRALVFHEYTHILHMGDVFGAPSWVNAVFGRMLMPNASSPRFLTEGLATWAETRMTGGDLAVAGHGGRVDSPVFMAQLRANVLDGGLPELSELTGVPLRWPRGDGWYLYGSLLLDDLAQTGGPKSIRRFIDAMAPRLFGVGLEGLARYTWGKSLTRAWQDAQARLRARVLAKWRERAGAELPDATTDTAAFQRYVRAHDGEQLTHDAEQRGRIRSWPDGGSAVVAHLAGDAQLNKIERIFADGRVTTLRTCRGDCDEPMVTPDARWLLYTETRRWKRLYAFRDLIAVPLDEAGNVAGAELQLTRGARLRSTSVSDDGKWLFAVRIDKARTAIDALPLPEAITAAQAGDDPPQWQRRVAPAPLGQTLDSPLLLPDGHLIWTAWHGGHRGLESDLELDAAACEEAARALGHKTKSPHWIEAQACPNLAHMQPAWLGDLQLPHGVPADWQLSAVVEVDGFREAGTLTHNGWSAQTQTLTGVTSQTGEHPPFTVRLGARGLDVFRLAGTLPRQLSTSQPEHEDLPYHPTRTDDVQEGAYNPLRSVWPRAWRPLLLATGDQSSTAPGGVWLGAQVGGGDALAYWDWLAIGQIRDDGTDPRASLTVDITRWEPTWTLATTYQQGSSTLQRGFAFPTTPTDRWALGLRGSWTIPEVRRAWTVDAGFRVVRSTLRDANYRVAFPYEPGGPAPVEPWTGYDVFLDGGVAWVYAASSPDAGTAESVHAFSLRGSVSDSWTGGARRRVIAQAAGDNRWPLGHHFVAQITSNVAMIPISGDAVPSLLVRGPEPLTSELLFGAGQFFIPVRGMPYAPVWVAGQGMAWGTAQLFIPVMDIGRGLGTLPIWFGRLRASPFVDGAWAFLPPARFERYAATTWSTGMELLLNWEGGFVVDGTLRVGAGHAFYPQNTAWWLMLGI